MKSIETCKIHGTESQKQLKINGLKITPARMALLDIFKHASKPLNIKELSDKIKTHGTDLVTLYRNVENLAHLNIIKKVNLGGREAYYELESARHHHHLVCTNCGRLADIEIPEKKLNAVLIKKLGFSKITSHSLEFFGLCHSCDK